MFGFSLQKWYIVVIQLSLISTQINADVVECKSVKAIQRLRNAWLRNGEKCVLLQRADLRWALGSFEAKNVHGQCVRSGGKGRYDPHLFTRWSSLCSSLLSPTLPLTFPPPLFVYSLLSLYFCSLEACVQHIRMSSMYPPVARQELWTA